MRGRQIFTWTVAGLVLGSLAAAQRAVGDERPIGGTVTVPFDYANLSAGSFPLYYELGRPFDRTKPTVFAIVDGQQFYVRRNALRGLQDSLFGDQFNVVGIPGRGTEEAVLKRVTRDGATDWRLAWSILQSDRWVEDIEHVRQRLLGPQGRVSLYGRSGGGFLVHQYLARYGNRVSTVFTQAAVNRFIDASLGLNSDTFWADIGRVDPRLQTMLLDSVAQHANERPRIVLALQRQNFFVPARSLDSERRALIEALARWDEDALRRYFMQYQVEDVLKTLGTASIGVRVFELFAPVLAERRVNATPRLDPDLEVGELFSEALLKLLRDGTIQPPTMNLAALHGVRGEIYMLAGRFDHTADYRTQIALAAHYPQSRLLLLADDHNFLQLQKTGLYPSLVQSALLHGVRGPGRDGVEERLSSLVYRE